MTFFRIFSTISIKPGNFRGGVPSSSVNFLRGKLIIITALDRNLAILDLFSLT